MQDNENLSETEPTATDETAGGDLESTARFVQRALSRRGP